VSVANGLLPPPSLRAPPASTSRTVSKAAPDNVVICEMSLGIISTPEPATSQLPPLRFPFCSWTGLSASRSVPVAPTDRVPVVFENAGLVMEQFSYASISPGFGMAIDAAESVVPFREMNPSLISALAIETLPDPKMSDPPSAT
jgi:hypothetical protein